MASVFAKSSANAQRSVSNRLPAQYLMPLGHCSFEALTQRSLSKRSLGEHSIAPPEQLATHWLEKLLQHFGVRELKDDSDQNRASLLAYLAANYRRESGEGGDRHSEDCLSEDCHSDDLISKERFDDRWIQSDLLLSEINHKVVRIAGAQLNDTFTAMAPDVVDLEDTEVISITAEGRTLRGVRYEGNIYRLIETFAPRHRLQAFCLAQTLNEQRSPYLITRSLEYFAVWVNIQASPRRSYTL